MYKSLFFHLLLKRYLGCFECMIILVQPLTETLIYSFICVHSFLKSALRVQMVGPRSAVLWHGGLNENDSNRLTGHGTTRRCDLVRIGAALLKEVCNWGGLCSFKCSCQTLCYSLFLLSVDSEVELLATFSVSCLFAYNQTSCHNNNGSNL